MPSYRLAELAERIGATVSGAADLLIDGVAPLDRAGAAQVGFLTNPRYRALLAGSRAGVLLVAPDVEIGDRTLLVHAEPQLALVRLLEIFHPEPAVDVGVDPSAVVAADVEMGADLSIGPRAVIESGVRLGRGVRVGAGCVVGRDCTIGESSEIRPNAVLYPRTQIGRRCLIHSGAVLGADGFGFATVNGIHHKIPQVARVVIEDDVEIGANSAIDRGALEDTVIGAGSKIDDLVMIAHGVRVGRGALLAAQSGIAGSTRIGEYSTFAGQSGVAGHLEVGARTLLGAKSALLSDLPQGGFVAGIPAVDHRRWKRTQVAARKLPELHQRLAELSRRLAEIERRIESSEENS